MTQTRTASRIHEIRRLAKQLHWADARESQDYERTKAAVTQRLLKELDNYVDGITDHAATTTAGKLMPAATCSGRDSMPSIQFG
jgi:hypothetical protein